MKITQEIKGEAKGTQEIEIDMGCIKLMMMMSQESAQGLEEKEM